MENSFGHRISKLCPLCNKPVDPEDPDTWKQVRGWVGGPRKDSMRLREDTGYFAHHDCVAKVQEGQSADQSSIFDPQAKGIEGTDVAELEGLLDDSD